MSNSLHESEPVVGAGVSMAMKEGFMERRGLKKRRRRTSNCRKVTWVRLWSSQIVVVVVEVEVEVEVVGRGSWGGNRNLGGSTVKAMMTLSAIREVDRTQAVSGLVVPHSWLLTPRSATAAQRLPYS
jgi:hypothetical protein